MLTIVATPIGNLKDITLRALEALQAADAVVCEDTRVTGKLLHHFQISKPMQTLNDFNENRTFPHLINLLQNGQNLVLVSDAGTPLINDPGFKLVRECIKEGIAVDSIPGPSAPITALTLSGLPPDKFLFLGYPPDKPGHRLKLFQNLTSILRSIEVTVIMFVSPHKVVRNLEEMLGVFGDIEITLAKELTKMFQKVESKPISEWIARFKKSKPKGEYVLLLRV
jgi:16S rRNA (cytidine1402-2'-O)-methyltransferase